MASSLGGLLSRPLRAAWRGVTRGDAAWSSVTVCGTQTRQHSALSRDAMCRCESREPQSSWNPSPGSVVLVQKRWMWKMLNQISNKPDWDRIKEAGAQRACAEWLVRCGAHVRWEGVDKWEQDFNSLPPDVEDNYTRLKIAEVNADNASIMYNGFIYFTGVDTLKRMRFNQCEYFDDDAATGLYRLKDTLEHLEISSCHRLTEKGLKDLGRMGALKTLTLRNLSGVKNKQPSLDSLKQDLPQCEVTFLGGDEATQTGQK